ncbi:MAG: LamG domain-containing protein [Phycisphaerae bacterium]|jgi:hypothetical protein
MKVSKFEFITIVFVCIFGSSVFAGGINTALQFDGTNDYVVIPDNDALSPQAAGQMTVSTWVKIDAWPIGNNEVVLAKSTDYQSEYNVGITTTGQVNFTLWRPTGSHYAFAMGGTITLGQWHNITGTYNQSDAVKVYLDGILVNQSNSWNPPMGGNGTASLDFGKIGGSTTPCWFNGTLDDVSIWNYAKTDAEVLNSFNQTLIGTESGLAAAWNFNEGSGQVVTDITGHGNNGILGSGSGVDSADPTWVVVPEPATMALLALGGLMLRRRMK